MTPRAEDSDDDLPELEDLVKSFRAGNAQKEAGKGNRGVTTKDAEPVTGKRRKGKSSEENDEAKEELGVKGKEGEGEGKVVKEVKKKRVLNQRADNPLLRPLNARSVSSDLSSKTTKTRIGRSKKAEVERDVAEDEEPVSRTKSRRYVIPAEEAISADEKAVGKPSLKPSRGKPRVRDASEDLKLVQNTKSRSVTPLEEPAPDEEDKPTAKSRTRKADGSKQPRKAELKLELEPEKDCGDPEEKLASRSRPGKVVASKQQNARRIVLDSELEDPDSDKARPAANSKPSRITKSKQPKRRGQVLDSEGEEPEEVDSSDDLSDFVVNDSTFLECDDSLIEMPPLPPRSTRKLVQGRRWKKEEESDDDGLDLELKKLSIKDDVPIQGSRETSEVNDLEDFAEGYSDDEVPVKSVPRKLFGDVRLDPPKKVNDSSPGKNDYAPSSDIEDPFTLR